MATSNFQRLSIPSPERVKRTLLKAKNSLKSILQCVLFVNGQFWMVNQGNRVFIVKVSVLAGYIDVLHSRKEHSSWLLSQKIPFYVIIVPVISKGLRLKS